MNSILEKTHSEPIADRFSRGVQTPTLNVVNVSQKFSRRQLSYPNTPGHLRKKDHRATIPLGFGMLEVQLPVPLVVVSTCKVPLE